ncbi:SPOR domain-containing protein [Sulfitobacter sp. D35]|uniref:SPOR domain-containing protein n=1 Tax=Sulfitobacter sp. D35 TaxID=3083252 RepID=UPI00296FCBBE|nr:SPOR domain-containing protein [Sulfitobacter sp. D35]MDW4499437.1 SPOR domain-containing protein [Sulfitobacter sp. D35]
MSRAYTFKKRRRAGWRWGGVATVFTLLAGCDDTGSFSLKDTFKAKPEGETAAPAADTASGLERDVEAPEVFSVTEEGLWDGRPSLGGVWVAHPDVKEPERVMIRNAANGKSVVGALFRRERETPGPVLQISSDAATSLDVLAGAPVQLSVVALRRETVAAPAPAAAAVPEPDAVTETPLDPVAATASAAIEASEPAAAAAPAAAELPTSNLPLKRTAAAVPAIGTPYIQIGIFSVAENAEGAARQMRGAGLEAEVRKQSASGKTFWRVLVGPAGSTAERDRMLARIKGAGFTDAYAVAN